MMARLVYVYRAFTCTRVTAQALIMRVPLDVPPANRFDVRPISSLCLGTLMSRQ